MSVNALETWFQSQRWTPFAFQRETWRAYLDGRSGLVHAPTGTGKTYAVWLGPLAEEIEGPKAESRKQKTADAAIRVLWITPLRALANDTAHNLCIAVDGLNIPWRVELRHGDTSSSARQRQRTKPPEALITTPESLSVLLSYPGASEHFRSLRCVIVDEWHELLSSKRGVQTELALARLRTLAAPRALRTWGLSATLGNLEQAMNVLLGERDAASGMLIRGDSPKRIAVTTLLPDDVERFPWSGHIGVRMLDQVIAAIERAKTTLIFTNVRSAAEIWFQAILKARPDLVGQIALHHGSLDREIRQKVEQMLRDGALRCVVCTSSLDLGVDFSPVDQVLQIGSPKGIARMMQRAGRSGHQPGATSAIVGVPTMALEMIEFAAAREAAGMDTNSLSLEGGGQGVGDAHDPERRHVPSIEKQARRHETPRASTHPPAPSLPGRGSRPQVESREPIERPLDVLVQHLVTLACGDGFDAQQLRDEVRSTHAFAKLSDDEWQWCMDFITRGGAALTAYPQYSRVKPATVSPALEGGGQWVGEALDSNSLAYDASSATQAVNEHITAHDSTHPPAPSLRGRRRYVVAGRTIERMHRMSIGTITSDSAMKVAFLRGTTLGMIEEGFISRLHPGDRFVFAGRVLELIRVRDMTAFVRPAKQTSGTVPRWGGSKSPLSTLLSQAIRCKFDEARCGIFNSVEMEKVRPLLELQGRWSRLPAPDEVLVERIRTREGHHTFIFPFEGRLVHEGLCSLVAHRVTQREPRSVQVTGNDYGFELQTLKPLDVNEDILRDILTTDRLVEDLLACVNTTALARRQFREIARVAGLLFPGFPGQPKSMRQLQASSSLFYEVFEQFDPRNLLLDQAKREVLDRELEVTRLRATLERIERSRLVIMDVPHLTPLSFPLWAESMRTQQVSSERWSERVKRMVVQLEAAADTLNHRGTETQRQKNRGRKAAARVHSGTP